MQNPRTLADLIRSHQDSTGDSYSDIAKRAGLSKAKIGQLAITTQPHMPRVDTVEKLAKGLQLPLHIVQRAAMASAGITPPDAEEISESELLVAKLERLNEHERAIIARLVDSFIAEADTVG